LCWREPHQRVKRNGFNDNNPLHIIFFVVLFVSQQHTIFIKHSHHNIAGCVNNQSTR
jgi:hypothetical protein